jgi:hypothetical protein
MCANARSGEGGSQRTTNPHPRYGSSYKRHTAEECMSYDDAVEEALCFGWIDTAWKLGLT